jgi:hypothetical protein
MDEQHNPDRVISRTEKPTAQVYSQLKPVTATFVLSGHLVVVPTWGGAGTLWYQNQTALWQEVK